MKYKATYVVNLCTYDSTPEMQFQLTGHLTLAHGLAETSKKYFYFGELYRLCISLNTALIPAADGALFIKC